MKCAVIGSGPAGVASAITLARKGLEVVVYEASSTSLKKLLLTGNGRCNITNEDLSITHFHSSNNELIKNIINEENIKLLYDFFESIGIVLKNKNGYFYPYSLKSSSIKSSLMTEARYLGIKFIYNQDIKNIEFKNNKFIIYNQVYEKLVLATGSSEFGYKILRDTNHFVVDKSPSLVPLVTNLGIEDKWAGFRVEANVSLYENDKLIHTESGEVQFTKYGLSGICIFNLSRYVRQGLNNGLSEVIHINFLNDIVNVRELLVKRNKLLKGRNITELLDMFIDYKLLYILLKYIKINPDKRLDELSESEVDKLCKVLTDFEVRVVDTLDITHAQVASGGLSLKEVNLDTMESLKVKNLHVVGELLDIDGDCGGYNLTAYFITGLRVGNDKD